MSDGGPRPVRELAWWPHPAIAQAVRIKWIGSGGKYRVFWGDGTSELAPPWAVPAHTYDTSGTYELVVVAEHNREITDTARITVRDFVEPEPSASVDGATMTVRMPHVDDPVHWSIAWGDGATTEHTEHEAQHDYPWGFGAPDITVVDVPSRRMVTFTGPAIGDEPKPEFPPIDGVLLNYIGQPGETRRRFALLGGNLGGNWVRYWWGEGDAQYVTVDGGAVRHEVDVPKPAKPEMDQWRSMTVQYYQGDVLHTRFLPVNVPLAASHSPQVTYEFGEVNDRGTALVGDPFRLVFSVTEHQKGTHHIDFGDGTVETVELTHGPLAVPHVYDRSASQREFEVRITLPDGTTTMPRLVYPHTPSDLTYRSSYYGKANLTWARDSSTAAMPRDQFAPVVMGFDPSHGRPLHRLHAPTVAKDCWITAYQYTFTRSGTYYYRLHQPLADAAQKSVNIAKAFSGRMDRAGIDVITVGQLVVDGFEIEQRWSSGYVGTFTVSNTGNQEVGQWSVRFHLGDGAAVHNAWCRGQDATVVDEGHGWWRVSTRTPLPGGTSAYLGVRVAPCGSPTLRPEQYTAHEG